MTDSSVVPIDVGVGAREQALPPEAAGEPKEQPTRSPLEPSKAVNNAVDDPTAKERDALAEQYFKNDLADQWRWYSQKAGLYKTRSELLALLTIVLGALITFIQVFGAAPWVPFVSGSIGAIVAIAAGWQRIGASGRSPTKRLWIIKQQARVHGRRLALQLGWHGSGRRSVLGCARRGVGGVAERRREGV